METKIIFKNVKRVREKFLAGVFLPAGSGLATTALQLMIDNCISYSNIFSVELLSDSFLWHETSSNENKTDKKLTNIFCWFDDNFFTRHRIRQQEGVFFNCHHQTCGCLTCLISAQINPALMVLVTD